MKSKIQEIINVTNECLDSIDIEQCSYLRNINDEYYEYMRSKSGKEHYRLLVFISLLFNNETFLDIGTNRGFSAIALANNKSNKVISYDIEEYDSIPKLKSLPICSNILFKIGNFLEMEDINNVKLIMLDTAHDGFFEEEVINHLKKNRWNGILLMDDINHTFVKLKEVWENIDLEKYDLTNLGHYSGTGMVIFNENIL